MAQDSKGREWKDVHWDPGLWQEEETHPSEGRKKRYLSQRKMVALGGNVIFNEVNRW